MISQFAWQTSVLPVFKVFRFQFSTVKNILKKIYHFTETTVKIAKSNSIQKLPHKI